MGFANTIGIKLETFLSLSYTLWSRDVKILAQDLKARNSSYPNPKLLCHLLCHLTPEDPSVPYHNFVQARSVSGYTQHNRTTAEIGSIAGYRSRRSKNNVEMRSLKNENCWLDGGRFERDKIKSLETQGDKLGGRLLFRGRNSIPELAHVELRLVYNGKSFEVTKYPSRKEKRITKAGIRSGWPSVTI
jgi:hypothetical protein